MQTLGRIEEKAVQPTVGAQVSNDISPLVQEMVTLTGMKLCATAA